MWLKRLVAAVALLSVSLVSPRAAHAGDGTLVQPPGAPAAALSMSVFFEYDEADPNSWLPLFNAASALLYDATEQQVQFGTITLLLNGCPDDKERADVVISAGTEGARADVLGLGQLGRHIYLSQAHKGTGGADVGQHGFVQQIARYLFGVESEHAGITSQTPLPPEAFITGMVPPEAYFCELPLGQGSASLMDGGTLIAPDNLRTEFCTPTFRGGATAHFAGFSTGSIGVPGQPEIGRYTRNMQQALHGKSTWETIAEVALARYGLPLIVPAGVPVSDTTGHADLIPGGTWVTGGACAPVVPPPDKLILVIDKSGSMATNDRIGLAKIGAKLVVDSFPLGRLLGVVAYESVAAVEFPTQELVSQSTRAAAKAAIDNIVLGATTNVTDGLAVALQQIRDTTRFTDERIVLLADGDHNTGPDPFAALVVDDLVAEGITVNTIAVGTDIIPTLLQDIASTTGGIFAAASTPEELPDLLLQLSGTPPPTQFVTLQGAVMQGERARHLVRVDEMTDRVQFQMNFIGVSGDMPELELSLFPPGADPDVDPPLAPDAPGVTFTSTPGLQTYDIMLPVSPLQRGVWTMEVLGARLAAGVVQSFDLRVQDPIGQVQVTVEVTPRVPMFVEPARIEAIVVSDGPPVAGANVRADIARPDGTVVSGFPLFDDGAAAHGDSRANDGIYTNLFAAYSGDGQYEGRVFVDNVAAGTRVLPDEQLPAAPSLTPVPAFQRERAFTFSAENTPATGPIGDAEQRPAIGIPDASRELRTDVTDEVVLGLRLAAGTTEPVLIERIVFDGAGTGDETALTNVRLYLDRRNETTGTDEPDGSVDPVGYSALPVGVSGYDADDGHVEFQNVAVIQPGETIQLLLTYEVDLAAVRAAAPAAAAAAGALPVAALLVIPALLAGRLRRFRMLRLPVRFLCVAGAFTVLSCAGGGGGGGGGAFDAPAPDPNAGKLTFEAAVSFNNLEMRGAVSGQPIVVSNPAPAIGPVLTITP